MPKMLHLAPGLKLNAEDFIERATGFIGKRGRGKSGAVKVIEEALLKAGLPFVVFDPVGIHWGLKADFLGKKPSGYEVIIVGGEHADIPLQRGDGRVIAQMIADKNVSLIIDFKGSAHAVYRQFVTDFCDELNNINKHPRLLIFEEAARLLPQRLRPDQTACFDAVARCVLEGRNAALGCILIGQRASTLNKDVLTQVDNLIVMGITGPQDRKAVLEWVEQNADSDKIDEFLNGLAMLQPREAWIWAPDADIFQKIRFRDFTTFHPDRTHLRRLGLLKVRPVLTDVSSLVDKIKGTLETIIEKAKENDPAALKRQIADLERTNEILNRQLVHHGNKTVVVPKVHEVPVLKAPQIKRLEKAAERIEKAIDNARSIAATEFHQVVALRGILQRFDKQNGITIPFTQKTVTVSMKPKPKTNTVMDVIRDSVSRSTAVRIDAELSGEQPLYDGERRILAVMAQRHPIKMTVGQMATLAGMVPSGGTFKQYYRHLKRDGYIQERGSEAEITQKGLDLIGPDTPPPPKTREEVLAMWGEKLYAGQRKMLEALAQQPYTIEDLGIVCDMVHTGGTFKQYYRELKRNGLIEEIGDTVQLSERIFEGYA